MLTVDTAASNEYEITFEVRNVWLRWTGRTAELSKNYQKRDTNGCFAQSTDYQDGVEMLKSWVQAPKVSYEILSHKSLGHPGSAKK